MPGQEVDQRKLGERLWKKNCQARKLNREDAMDCNRWRKQIRDRSEWVNVSSGTGSPGLSGQNPESRKTIVLYVCVYHYQLSYAINMENFSNDRECQVLSISQGS